MLPDVHETLHVSFNEVFRIGQKRFSFGTNFVYFYSAPLLCKKISLGTKEAKKNSLMIFVKRGRARQWLERERGSLLEATDTYTLL